MGVRVENVSKSFGTVPALDHISFTVTDGSLLSVLGPSGSGKTTLLRCIAGVETPDEGRIEVGGRTVFDSERGIDEPPEKRGLGMVFQSYALWPHMTARENVAYPLKLRKDKEEGAKVKEMLASLKLEGLADRYPGELSGGEQQRVALARAMVYEPPVVLLDEPFSNLDVPLKEALRDELRMVQKRMKLTVVYVTHDRIDALSISDELCILSSGRSVASGTPSSILKSPPNSYVARFVVGMLVVDGKREGSVNGKVAARTKYGIISVPAGPQVGDAVKVCIPPTSLRVGLEGGEGRIPATINGLVRRTTGAVNLRLATDSGVVEVEAESQGNGFSPGDRVFLEVDPLSCLILTE